MNLLGKETSPYLHQHKDNPVHWMPWNEFAFQKAKAEGKPVLLSIGYSSCHWCHVMAHESFDNPATAELMNKNFINIKVDREERPDIDAYYQRSLMLTGQQGGWPLTMFLTPDKEAFWGGTYFPPHARHSLPSFRDVLNGIHESYAVEKDKIAHNTRAIRDALHKLQAPANKKQLTQASYFKAGERIYALVDKVHGGIGAAPKFPNLPGLWYLWDLFIRTGDLRFKSAVIASLAQMCQGGIYDHVGGGFFRYSTDGEWLVPHFEKMLCDNGLFLSLLSDVCRETANPLFALRIRETADWILREMAVSSENQTAFASGLDADSFDAAGALHEGIYYVWKLDEVAEALGDNAKEFADAYDITRFGNWEGVNIPNQLRNPGLHSPEEEARLGMLRKKLRDRRQLRPAPARDGKVLADWNGLAISGLARAGYALKEEKYITAAKSAFAFVCAHMQEEEGRLHHSYAGGKASHPPTLEDYANMSEAALVLYEMEGNSATLQAAERWAQQALDNFQDETGGFFNSASGDLPLRLKVSDDTSVPSGNGSMVGVLQRLYYHTGKDQYRDVAEDTVTAFAAQAEEFPLPLASLLRHGMLGDWALQLHIPSDAFGEELRKVSGAALIPMHEKPAKSEALICINQSCLPAFATPEEFGMALREERVWPVAANDS